MKSVEEIAKEIERELLEKKIVNKLEYQDYYLLSTPDALNRKNIFIIVSGHPEIAGVWSNTLLSQGQLTASSMESYFKAFHNEGWGLIALNPHLIQDDLVGTNYYNQIAQILKDSKPESNLGFIGFSMGGRIIYDFLNSNNKILERTIAIVQIDPVIQQFKWDPSIIDLLKSKTILFASSTDPYKFGIVSSHLLSISYLPIEGIHGTLPSKCLKEIIKFIKKEVENL